MADDLVASIIQVVHPEFLRKEAAWRRNERRFQGGEDVYEDLRRFQWEVNALTSSAAGNAAQSALSSYADRKAAAVWVEFPSMVAEQFVGGLFQAFPAIGKEPGSGLYLGKLTQPLGKGKTRADVLLENADGVGSDARSLEAFWFDAMASAMATKHRWILAEKPPERAGRGSDEVGEARPYLVDYSPLDVPFWHYHRQTLQCARIVLSERNPRMEDGEFKFEAEEVHYLMTREGFQGWGPKFAGGGWWKFDSEGNLLKDRQGNDLTGDWRFTGGEIPLVRLYYERSRANDTRTGITHVGNVAAEFMNQLSAMTYDAWTGGSGLIFLAGVDPEQWEVVTEHGMQGSKIWPIPPARNQTNMAKVEVIPISAFDASPAIERSLQWLLKLSTQLIMRELTTAPDASGAARRVQFLQGKSPRLSNMAINIEEAMNTAHRFLEQRWMPGEPTFSVKWERSFDLRTVTEKVKGVLELLVAPWMQAPSLVSEFILLAAKSEGLLSEAAANEEGLEEAIRQEMRLASGVARQEVAVRTAERADGRLLSEAQGLEDRLDGIGGGDGQ